MQIKNVTKIFFITTLLTFSKFSSSFSTVSRSRDLARTMCTHIYPLLDARCGGTNRCSGSDPLRCDHSRT